MEDLEGEQDEKNLASPITFSMPPTKSDSKSIKKMLSSLCWHPSWRSESLKRLNAPSDAPEGYMCLYESFFTYCKLWFPLSYMFVKYYERRGMAFTQPTTVGVGHMVILVMLGSELGIPVSVKMFEEMTSISSGSAPGSFYIKMKPKFKLITGFKSKVNNSDRHFLFVKKNKASMTNVKAKFITEWSSSIGSRLC